MTRISQRRREGHRLAGKRGGRTVQRDGDNGRDAKGVERLLVWTIRVPRSVFPQALVVEAEHGSIERDQTFQVGGVRFSCSTRRERRRATGDGKGSCLPSGKIDRRCRTRGAGGIGDLRRDIECIPAADVLDCHQHVDGGRGQ